MIHTVLDVLLILAAVVVCIGIGMAAARSRR